MTNISLSNAVFTGFKGRKSPFDLEIPDSFHGKLVVFCHGFMGYKDWGCWNLVQKHFVSQGFGFCKYNVSHNGGTVENPIDFSDLKAFSENTYSGEIEDLSCILKTLESHITIPYDIYLIGHSRGGGTVLLSGQHERVKAIAGWAAISSIGNRFPDGIALERWKNEGVRFVKNGRTHQEMPMKYGLYEDYLAHESHLDIQAACEKMTCPTLVVHGDQDTSVPLSEGEALSGWLNSELVVIKGADHTFCSAHPWKNSEMPNELLEVCELTADFFLTR
jgi:pimeloyl-ACP methyl ester carboxylesterase